MTGALLTTLEVAERLGISSWAVAQAVRSGVLQPTAQTNDDFLFTERSVAAFAERKAAAAATPLAPPAAVSRTEWSGDIERLNTWLKDLNESVPATARPTDTIALPMPAPPTEAATPPSSETSAVPIAVPEEALPAVDFTPPPRPAAETAAEPPAAPDPEPAPEAAVVPVTVPRPVAVPEVAAEPALRAAVEPDPPVTAEPEPLPALDPGPFLTPATVTAAPLSAAAAEPEAVAETHLPTVAEATEPLPEAVAALRSGLSRQAVLVVEPIERFRVLRDVADRLATIPGVADARLERLEGGLASYRLSFGDVRPSGEAIANALSPLGLQVMLVDSQ